MCIGGAVANWLTASRVIDALAIGFSAPAIISSLLADKHGENPFIKRVPPSPTVIGQLQKWWSGHPEGIR
jgi:hypothetical protein